MAIDVSREIIVDSCEKYPMLLRDDSSRCRVGDEGTILHVAEIREVICTVTKSSFSLVSDDPLFSSYLQLLRA